MREKFVRTGELGEQLKIVLGILDETLAAYPVDSQRVYLTGLSMGGYGAWDLAVRFPERFAAVAPICGGGDERLRGWWACQCGPFTVRRTTSCRSPKADA